MSAPKFVNYSSIENLYREKFIAMLQESGVTDAHNEWSVTEKIHGANFSLAATKDVVRACSRNNMLGHDANFCNVHHILDSLKEKAQNLFNELSSRDPEITQVTVFGELAGGEYPHPEVKRVSGVKRVQKGVFYCPQLEFFGFDVAIFHGEQQHIVNGDFAREAMLNAGFNIAPLLFRGTFEECSAYANEFNTFVPAMFGLPEIADNVCEGVVLKPEMAHFVMGERAILKNKNDKFSERSRTKDNKKQASNEGLSAEVIEAKNTILEYVNENRLNNLFSKIGKISDHKDIGKYIKLLSEDALEDATKDNEELFGALSKADQKVVNKTLSGACGKLILRHI